MEVHCKSCRRTNIIWPWDEFNIKLSKLFVNSTAGNVYNFLLDNTMPSMYFKDESFKSSTYMLYSPTFDYPCSMNNDECHNNQNHTDIQIIFNQLNLSDNNYFNITPIIILYDLDDAVFYAPEIDDLSYLSIICITCSQIQFNLLTISNTALTLISTTQFALKNSSMYI